jgi:hypothetical protein
MRIVARALPLLLLLFTTLSLAPEARAEHVVITSGTLSHRNPVLNSFPGYSFNFAGAGISASGSDERLGSGGSAMSCLPCAAGQTFGTSSHITRFSTVATNAATYNGTTYTNVLYNGSSFDFVVEPVVIPFDAPNTFTLTAAFTFNGILQGAVPPSFAAPIFSMTLSGQGIATLTFALINLNGNVGYGLTNISYNFQPAASTVPEPATLLLLGTGLAGVAARMRGRRTTRASRRGAGDGAA